MYLIFAKIIPKMLHQKWDQDEYEGYWMEGDSLAPPCQSEDEVIASILDLIAGHYEAVMDASSNVEVPVNPLMYDLGCGDGRICVEGCKRFPALRAIGCEIEESLIPRMKKNISDFGLEDRMEPLNEDLRNISLDGAHIIVVYLLAESIAEIKPKLIHALLSNHGGEGCVVVCNSWGIKDKDVTPNKKVSCGYGNNTTLFLYDRSSVGAGYVDTYVDAR